MCNALVVSDKHCVKQRSLAEVVYFDLKDADIPGYFSMPQHFQFSGWNQPIRCYIKCDGWFQRISNTHHLLSWCTHWQTTINRSLKGFFPLVSKSTTCSSSFDFSLQYHNIKVFFCLVAKIFHMSILFYFCLRSVFIRNLCEKSVYDCFCFHEMPPILRYTKYAQWRNYTCDF